MSSSARKVYGFVLLSVVTILTLGMTWLFASYEWKSSAQGDTVIESYIMTPDGRFKYGDYCDEDGTILDGGIVCNAYEVTVPVRTGERVIRVIALATMTLGAGAFALYYIVNTMLRQNRAATASRTRPHPQI